MTKRVIGSLLVVLAVSGILFSNLSAQAKDGKDADDTDVTANKSIEIRPDIGPHDPKSIVGEHGYKVFNPGAIKSAVATPLERNLESAMAASSTRRGATDAWLAWSWSWDWKKWGWDHNAYHDSQSDLWEEEIWADGRLKIKTDSSWRRLCSDHTGGSRADCSNTFFQLLPRTLYSETDHHFHKSGYVDDNFMTNDSA